MADRPSFVNENNPHATRILSFKDKGLFFHTTRTLESFSGKGFRGCDLLQISDRCSWCRAAILCVISWLVIVIDSWTPDSLEWFNETLLSQTENKRWRSVAPTMETPTVKDGIEYSMLPPPAVMSRTHHYVSRCVFIRSLLLRMSLQ